MLTLKPISHIGFNGLQASLAIFVKFQKVSEFSQATTGRELHLEPVGS